jgi:uncharacterized Tic20 family protein
MTDEQNRQPNDSERVSRLASPGNNTADDSVVREYEDRYRVDLPRGEKPKRKPLPSDGNLPRSYSTLRVSDDEKLWAAIAHASAWITILAGILSIGAVVPVSVFIPLVIYFVFRRRSDYVAFHALQAFVLQLAGTLGALALLLVGGLVWGVGLVVALLLMVILIGFILVPVWGIVGIALLLSVVAMPIAMILFGTIAAIETYNGRDYRYPIIARWVDRQMAGGFLNAA